jgi:hypothetical protein
MSLDDLEPMPDPLLGKSPLLDAIHAHLLAAGWSVYPFAEYDPLPRYRPPNKSHVGPARTLGTAIAAPIVAEANQ